MSTQKVKVRPLQDQDLEEIVRWNNDDEVECFMDGPQPKTLEECKRWYAECLKSRNYRLYAIENEVGVLLGELELDHISWRRREAELRIRIGEKEYWGQGYGRAAIHVLLRVAFGQLNLDQVYLRVYQFNTRAIRCYERVGFRKQACLEVA
jgi:RimJ/RimL family protein N-acetyltransferase